MAYTSPRTWVTGELVTATMMNTYIRDNQTALKTPPTDSYDVNQGSDYTTSATSFTDIDATNLSLTITTTGGAVIIGFDGYFAIDAGLVYLDVEIDGADMLAGDDGITCNSAPAADGQLSFVRYVELTAGSHTFNLQWKVNNGANTATLYAGAGTASYDLHPQFWIREMS